LFALLASMYYSFVEISTPFQISRLCNVQYRKFDFSRYPPHVRTLQTYAFKPIIIHVSDLIYQHNSKKIRVKA